MAVAIAYDDAKKNQNRIEGDDKATKGGFTNTRFFGSRDSPDLPQAVLAHWDPGRYSSAHFHMRDQFQVIVDGKGKVGRHELTAYSVHFARAYTPYGPLASDAASNLTFFVMRARPDPGAQRLPEKLNQLKQVPDRQPWQIRRSVTFPTLQSGTAATDIMLQSVPGIKDEQGLAAYTLSMKPNAQAFAPDPSHGDGQYLVVAEGSLMHGNNEYKSPALVFVEPKEGPFRIHSGSGGLHAIILNFPQVRPRTVHAMAHMTSAGSKKWQCALCAFAYDEAQGMPEEGILAGTRWEDVPDTWTCPDCSARKSDFQMVEA